MAIVRPRKLLYMAIDGPAPRAKMNQQRSRRFRASKESGELKSLKEKIRGELAAKGIHLEEKKKSGHFDSNCITPVSRFLFCKIIISKKVYCLLMKFKNCHRVLSSWTGWQCAFATMCTTEWPQTLDGPRYRWCCLTHKCLGRVSTR